MKLVPDQCYSKTHSRNKLEPSLGLRIKGAHGVGRQQHSPWCKLHHLSASERMADGFGGREGVHGNHTEQKGSARQENTWARERHGRARVSTRNQSHLGAGAWGLEETVSRGPSPPGQHSHFLRLLQGERAGLVHWKRKQSSADSTIPEQLLSPGRLPGLQK